MDYYQLNYDEEKSRLYIAIQGNWSYEIAKAYKTELENYVKPLAIRTALVDQRKLGQCSSEVMGVFAEVNLIPALMHATAALVVEPFVMKMMKETAHNSQDGAPMSFDDLSEAERYLDRLYGGRTL
jgi:hypothetical protein